MNHIQVNANNTTTKGFVPNCYSFEANLYMENGKKFMRIIGINNKALTLSGRILMEVETNITFGNPNKLYDFKVCHVAEDWVVVRYEGFTRHISKPTWVHDNEHQEDEHIEDGYNDEQDDFSEQDYYDDEGYDSYS